MVLERSFKLNVPTVEWSVKKGEGWRTRRSETRLSALGYRRSVESSRGVP
ncbi:MAG TPA: hypothetical protein VF041_04110 [Gemmatimonadaceae bacterium]